MRLEELPSPTIFAHRGASAYAPENTLAAFELAVRQNADAIELDAKLTADGHVVVIHDPTLERTTNGQGQVTKLTLAELQKLDAGSYFDPAFQAERIPTLDEVFERVGKDIYINVEITNYTAPLDALPLKIAECVHRHQMQERVIFSSFNWLSLWRIHLLVPEAPLGLLALPGQWGWPARSRLGRLVRYHSLHPALEDVTPALVQQAHRLGAKVFVYTVNRREDMHRLLEMGVDGIFTDDPLLARQVLMETGKSPADVH